METESVSRVDVIVQHILKNKKLQLPKAYVRNTKAYQAHYADMGDELTVEVVDRSETINHIEAIEVIEAIDHTQANVTRDVFEPVTEVQNEKLAVEKKQRAKKDKEHDKEKKPSAYNIFVKDAVKKLQDSHKHLGSKERFQLAIQMWNDHKKKNNVTTAM
jgi:hypothetical protein